MIGSAWGICSQLWLHLQFSLPPASRASPNPGMGLHRTSCGRQATARQRARFSGFRQHSRLYVEADQRSFLAPDWHPADHPKMPEIVPMAAASRPGLRVLHRPMVQGPRESSLADSV